MKRKLIRVFIVVISVVTISGGELNADGHQHLVQKGDTLWGLSRKYKVPLKNIIHANSIQPTSPLQIGKKLLIPGAPVGGVWYRVKAGDTLWSIAVRHNLEPRDLQRMNGISSPRALQIGTRLLVHQADSLSFGNPLRVPLVVTSQYGYRSHPVTRRYQHHDGIDFRASTGTRVYASRAGRVIFTGWKGGYGKLVGIEHEGDFSTWYGHLSRIRVRVGQTVTKGKVIGLSGNTGVSTGPHLHFEIRYKGRSENPTNHIIIP